MFASQVYNESKYYDISSLYLNTGIELDYLSNRTNDGWVYDKDYKYKNNITAKSKEWSNKFNSKINVESYLNYSKKIKTMFLFDIYSSDYNSLWRPVNDINKKRNENQYISLKKFEFNLKDYSYNLRYFQGIPHYSWKYEGDVFNLYQEQFETEKYINLGGKAVPEGVELNYTIDWLGDLDIVYGEPIWGKKDSIYAKQNFEIGYLRNNVLYRRERLPWQVSYGEQYEDSYAFSSEINSLLPFDLLLGVLYRPFRLDKEYEYLENVKDGTGYLGTNYLKKTEKTKVKDAFGYDAKIDSKNLYFFDYAFLDYKYLGILAGNKQEYNLHMDKVIGKCMLNLNFLDTTPLIDSNPLIYEGTTDNICQPLLAPRTESSPFRVDESNRKKMSADITLSYFYSIFNPRLLFNYDMGKIEDWNLNKSDNSTFICAFNYSLQKYEGNTDSQYYYDKDGKVLWESLGESGLWAVKEPLNVYSFFCKGRYNSDLNYNLFVQTGDSVATGSFPYNPNSSYSSITNFLDTDFGVGYRKYKLNLKYSKNNWGYEEWQRKFGITYSQLYKAEISRDFGALGVFAISYLNVFQDKYKTETIEIPSFEEIMLKWSYNFERVFLFKNKNKKINGANNNDNTPPEIKVSIQNNKLISLNDDGINDKINFNISVKDESNIYNWNIVIANEETNDVIFKKEGLGDVPAFFEWTINDPKQILNLKNGKYYIKVTATDIFSNSSESQPELFDLNTYKSILTKNSIAKLSQNSSVTIIENQNFITFQYNLRDVYTLSPSNVDKKLLDLLDILNNEKIYKIKILTYTNLGRNASENKNLSQKISQDVSKLLISYGVNSDFVENIGLNLSQNIENLTENTLQIICYYN
jgi:outer membrane protein OmpA-like peptidoglycan-associated protein